MLDWGKPGSSFGFGQTPSLHMLWILENPVLNSLVRIFKYKNTIPFLHSTAHIERACPTGAKPSQHSAVTSVCPSKSPREGNVTQHPSFLPCSLLAVEEVDCTTAAVGAPPSPMPELWLGTGYVPPCFLSFSWVLCRTEASWITPHSHPKHRAKIQQGPVNGPAKEKADLLPWSVPC